MPSAQDGGARNPDIQDEWRHSGHLYFYVINRKQEYVSSRKRSGYQSTRSRRTAETTVSMATKPGSFHLMRHQGPVAPSSLLTKTRLKPNLRHKVKVRPCVLICAANYLFNFSRLQEPRYAAQN